MKKIVLSLVAIVMIVCLSSKVNAQTISATASNSVYAEILTNLSITAVTPLSFGGFVVTAPGNIGSIVMDATTNNVSYTNITNVSGITNHPIGFATYTVAGAPSAVYSISLPGTFQISSANGGTPLTVKNFTSTYASNIGTIGLAGTDLLTVGAELDVPTPVNAGLYVGSFNVTVAY
jgi:hypothetical protein